MRRRIFSSHREDMESTAVNLTPLIDVVFVVLIMFIVIAPLLNIDNIKLASGNPKFQKDQFSIQSKSPITIHVKSNNSICFNSIPVSIDRLAILLRDAKKAYPNEKPQLFHDKRAFFGTYQDVKNSVEAAGFSQMDIVLRPE